MVEMVLKAINKRREEMVEILAKDLCSVGFGDKIHIKRTSLWTYCAASPYSALNIRGLISMTEEAGKLCKNCLREYRKGNQES